MVVVVVIKKLLRYQNRRCELIVKKKLEFERRNREYEARKKKRLETIISRERLKGNKFRFIWR